MNYLKQQPFISSILINVILFGAALAFCFPILNSGDDAYLMYLLGGGFGNAPTELLHYQYGLHPLFGWIVKSAFVKFPGFNWYAGFLYLFHFIACCAILWRSIKKNELPAGIAYYALFFVVELFFLLQPNFSNAALVMAVAGALLIYSSVQEQQRALKMIPGFILLLAAALLRLHMLIPVLILAAPFIITIMQRRQIKPLLINTTVLAALIVFAFFAQREYYIRNIPGWQQEEAYRQTIIGNYNVPKKPSNELKGELRMRADFLENGILWDKEFLSQQQVSATTKAVKLTTAASQGDFKQRLFWLLIESRMGILLMLIAFLLKSSSFTKKEKTAARIAALAFVALCTFLILFRKLPGYVVTGGMLQWIAFLIAGGGIRPKPYTARPVVVGAAAIIFVWGIIRINKLNESNIGQHAYWKCAYRELAFHNNLLLTVVDDRFPVDYFHVWDLPKKLPLENVLTKDHFLNNTYHTAFKKFNIQSLNDPAKILFIGSPSSILEDYYKKKNNRDYMTLPALKNAKCVKVWGLF